MTTVIMYMCYLVLAGYPNLGSILPCPASTQGQTRNFVGKSAGKQSLGILRKTIWGWIKPDAYVLHVKYALSQTYSNKTTYNIFLTSQSYIRTRYQSGTCQYISAGLATPVALWIPILSSRQADFWGWVKSDINSKVNLHWDSQMAYKLVPVSQSMYYPGNI